MASKARFFLLKNLWLTPFELFLFSSAAGIIWLAKWQDNLLLQQGYSRSAEPSSQVFPAPSTFSASSMGLQHDAEVIAIPAAAPPIPHIRPTNIRETEQLHKFLRKYLHYQRLRYQSSRLKKQDWEMLKKNATVNFGLVEEIFAAVAPEQGGGSVREILGEPLLAERVFRQIELKFGISRKDIDRFARDPQAAELAEWAFFIENRM